MFTAEDKAAILVEALPYIQQFYGKTIVIKKRSCRILP